MLTFQPLRKIAVFNQSAHSTWAIFNAKFFNNLDRNKRIMIFVHRTNQLQFSKHNHYYFFLLLDSGNNLWLLHCTGPCQHVISDTEIRIYSHVLRSLIRPLSASSCWHLIEGTERDLIFTQKFPQYNGRVCLWQNWTSKSLANGFLGPKTNI